MRTKIIAVLCIFLACAFLSSCAAPADKAQIRIVSAKTAVGVDDKYLPVGPTNIFTAGSNKIFLWFSWKGAAKDTKLVAKWRYVTEDISVLDYSFTIPRKEGSGSVSLAMPEGKSLPSGLYRVDLSDNGRQLKSLTFKVLEKK